MVKNITRTLKTTEIMAKKIKYENGELLEMEMPMQYAVGHLDMEKALKHLNKSLNLEVGEAFMITGLEHQEDTYSVPVDDFIAMANIIKVREAQEAE